MVSPIAADWPGWAGQLVEVLQSIEKKQLNMLTSITQEAQVIA